MLRPLLAVTRAEIEAYLRGLGQDWREDSSNRHLTFTRNRIRHELLPLLEGWNPRLREHLKQMAELARDKEAWWRLHAQGIVHAEVYISVGVIYMWRNFDPRCFEPIFAGLERARERAARELNLSLYWIFDAVRHFTVEEAERVFLKAAEMRPHYPSIVGIGLGGDERRTGSEPFRALYDQARAAGLRLTNHAGETTGPEAIWEALSIGSERIGHALSAIRDEKLLQN